MAFRHYSTNGVLAEIAGSVAKRTAGLPFDDVLATTSDGLVNSLVPKLHLYDPARAVAKLTAKREAGTETKRLPRTRLLALRVGSCSCQSLGSSA